MNTSKLPMQYANELLMEWQEASWEWVNLHRYAISAHMPEPVRDYYAEPPPKKQELMFHWVYLNADKFVPWFVRNCKRLKMDLTTFCVTLRAIEKAPIVVQDEEVWFFDAFPEDQNPFCDAMHLFQK